MELEMRTTWPVVLCNQFLDVNLLAHTGKTALRSINLLATMPLVNSYRTFLRPVAASPYTVFFLAGEIFSSSSHFFSTR
jgi:hypothetical protein